MVAASQAACRRRPAAWLAGALLWLACLPAQAHLLNMTRVQVDVAPDGAVQVAFSIDLGRQIGSRGEYYRLTHGPDLLRDPEAVALWRQLAQATRLTADGLPVELSVVSATAPPDSEAGFHDPLVWPMTELQLRGRLPAATADTRLQASFDPAFLFEEPIALTLRREADGRSVTRWLVASQLSPLFPLHADAATPVADTGQFRSEVTQYLVFGFEHILPRGLDHVLFVLGLFLGAQSLRSLLVLVTSFTLAHSLTLILSSYGAVRLAPGIVEPAIALSIAWIGVENVVFRSMRAWRAVLVFLFGLLHGMGFAAALSELGLPPRHFLAALLSFNVGVELGQLAVIALALLAVAAFRNRPWYRQRVVVPASLAIAALALFWTVQRIAG